MCERLTATTLGCGGAFFTNRLGRRVVEEGGVDVGEVGEFFSLNFAVDEILNGVGVFDFVGGEDGEGVSFFFGSAGSANAVDIIFRVFRDAVVDDVGDAGDVNATSGDVGGDENIVTAVLKA